jgi:sugar lactone lactonase YvrE
VAALLCITGLGVPAGASALTPGHILVSDYFGFDGFGGLIDVDPATGARTTVSANDHPVGTPNFNTPVVPAFEANGDIVVAEQDGDDVLRIDPATGARTTVSSSSVGTGPALSDPNGIAVAANGDLFVADFSAFDGNGGIFRIDPVTGNRTEVASNSHGSGPAFGFGPDGIAIAPDGSLVVVDTYGYQVLRVDPATGNRTTISSNSVGTGPTFDYVYGLALEPDGHILVGDRDGFDGNGGIIRIDPATGNRTTVSSNAVGLGPALNGPASLALAPDGSIITGTTGADGGAVFRVDPVSGNRTLISSNASPPGAPAFTEIYGVLIVPDSTYRATVLADAPAGYWRFGEPSGTALLDSSPNHNDGTYLGGVALGAPGALVASGDLDTAATYDGINDTGRVPDSATLHVGNSFTIEGWVSRSSTAKSYELFNKGAGGIQLSLMNAGSGNKVFLRKAGISTIAQSSIGILANGYHYVAATMNGPGTAKIYIDGVDVTQTVSAVQAIADTAFPLTFGNAAGASARFDGFALYDSVLTPAQIAAHYSAAL